MVSRPFAAIRRVGGEDPLTNEEAFEVLKSRRRRLVVDYLLGQSDPVPLSELVAQVTAWENDVSAGAIDPDDRVAVYASLHQTHLPKLVDYGLLTYDREDRTVSLTPRGERLQPFLTPDAVDEAPSTRGVLALSGVLVALLVAVYGNVWGFGQVNPFTVAVVAVGSFFLLSIVSRFGRGTGEY